MEICASEIRLATDIVGTWQGRRSNHIIVAPPMSRPRVLFSQLANKSFIETLLPEIARTILVSRLDTIHFKSEVTFVDAALAGWGLASSSELKGLDPVSKLESGVGILVKRGLKPILLVQRFHEALSKLGEDIGTTLRNLEHDLGLMTVVELPVSLAVLRERWDLTSDDKAPFLASDWGQGHALKLLKGYSRDEVGVLSKGYGSFDGEILDFVFDATSGLPDLVSLVLEECTASKIISIRAKVRRRSLASCGRIVDWLDKPADNLYKNLFCRSLDETTIGCDNFAVSLTDHDWRDLFTKNGGVQRPLMLGWACVDSLIESEDERFSNFVRFLFKDRKYSKILELADNANPPTNSFKRKWLGMKLLANFGQCSDPFDPAWASLAQVLVEVATYIDDSSGHDGYVDLRPLLEWRDLVGLMLRYQAAKQKRPSLRMEDFVCEENRLESDFSSFLQLLQLRFFRASEMEDYFAVKSIVEQPESSLQIYCYLQHGLTFWSCAELAETIGDRISAAMRRQFKLPAQGSRIGFVELMYLSFQLSRDAGTVDSFAPDFKAIEKINRLYDIRKDQVHGTGFVEPKDALAYRAWCGEWLQKLEAAFGGMPVPRLSTADILSSQLGDLRSS
jgi:hypothetical protein